MRWRIDRRQVSGHLVRAVPCWLWTLHGQMRSLLHAMPGACYRFCCALHNGCSFCYLRLPTSACCYAAAASLLDLLRAVGGRYVADPTTGEVFYSNPAQRPASVACTDVAPDNRLTCDEQVGGQRHCCTAIELLSYLQSMMSA
jgi:hypothetical protein